MLNPIPVEYVLSLHTHSPYIFRTTSVFIFQKKWTKLNNLEVLLFPIFLEMKSHRAHEYVAVINLHSYTLTELQRRLTYEYRYDEKLKTKKEESTRLSDTGLVVEETTWKCLFIINR